MAERTPSLPQVIVAASPPLQSFHPSEHSASSAVSIAQRRNVSLDVLRGAAILLVLGQHHDATSSWFHRIGWSGVDLFFVLSGFLVTGLMMKEQLTFGAVDVRRFLIRRGFKIYPAFWAMIAATLLVRWWLGQPIDKRALFCELAFVQNYGPGLWVSTWSLAVEEHFYLALAAVFVCLNRRAQVPSVRTVVRALVVGLLAILVLRCLTLVVVPSRYKFTYWGTHVRGDALMFGALIAYLHHCAPEALSRWVRVNRRQIMAASALLIVVVYILAGNELALRSLGYTAVYLAYGGVLLVAIHREPPTSAASRLVAWIGRHSYGIYLWHLLVGQMVFVLMTKAPLFPSFPSWIVPLFRRPEVYFLSSIFVGMSMSKLIEVPFLQLRNRLFPASKPPAPRLRLQE